MTKEITKLSGVRAWSHKRTVISFPLFLSHSLSLTRSLPQFAAYFIRGLIFLKTVLLLLFFALNYSTMSENPAMENNAHI